MITDAIFGILIVFLNAISSFFTTQADVNIGMGIPNAVATASSYYTAINSFFPVDTMILILLFDLAFEGGIYLTYKLVRWSYRKVPGIS